MSSFHFTRIFTILFCLLQITKIKTEPKTPSKQETPPVESTSGSSFEEKFFGFDNVELSKEQIKKQETFRKILGESTSLQIKN